MKDLAGKITNLLINETYNVFQRFGSGYQDDYFKLILTTFVMSPLLEAAGASSKNWLELKLEPP
jgi:hypothetical protein